MSRDKFSEFERPMRESTLGENFQKASDAAVFKAGQNEWDDDEGESEEEPEKCDSVEEFEATVERANEVLRTAKMNRTQEAVVKLTLKGLAQTEIARKLKISQSAVSQALAAATQKLEQARKSLSTE